MARTPESKMNKLHEYENQVENRTNIVLLNTSIVAASLIMLSNTCILTSKSARFYDLIDTSFVSFRRFCHFVSDECASLYHSPAILFSSRRL